MSTRARNKHSIGIKREPMIYECMDCDYKTRSKTGIKLHSKKSHTLEVTIHQENSLNQCRTCEKTFKKLEEIKKHVKLCHRQTIS